MHKPHNPIEYFRHGLGRVDQEGVSAVLNSLYLSSGPQIEAFELDFSKYLGVPYVIAVSSCTSALALTLRGLGIGPGSEVITTPLTFSATVAAILAVGAKPVFADVDPRTGLLDPHEVEKLIGSNTSAILVVHLYGTMVDMQAFTDIARRHRLRLIEDAAHCVEGSRDEYFPGSHSDAACFSFYATKNITGGEGGAIATRDKSLATFLKTARSHGIVRLDCMKAECKYVHWDILTPGVNAKMTEIQAALLRAQIPTIQRHLRRRLEIARQYDDVVDNSHHLSRPSIPAAACSARHLYTIWSPDSHRDRMLGHFETNSIGIGVHYRCLADLTYIKQMRLLRRGECPAADRIGDCTISIPLYPDLKNFEVDIIVNTIKSFDTTLSMTKI